MVPFFCVWHYMHCDWTFIGGILVLSYCAKRRTLLDFSSYRFMVESDAKLNIFQISFLKSKSMFGKIAHICDRRWHLHCFVQIRSTGTELGQAQKNSRGLRGGGPSIYGLWMLSSFKRNPPLHKTFFTRSKVFHHGSSPFINGHFPSKVVFHPFKVIK